MQLKRAYQNWIKELSDKFGEGEAHAITRIVFEDVLHWKKGRLDRFFQQGEEQKLEDVKKRLWTGEPLQYILGTADFYGQLFKVSPDVLIPRPETEELVTWVVETAAGWPDLLNILDVGTGSGCIPIIIKMELPAAHVCGIDVSKEALAIAKQNANDLGQSIQWENFDILNKDAYSTFPFFNFIVSNPPYIPHHEKVLMPNHVLDYEPDIALFVENDDPLIFYRAILEFSQSNLSADGWLFFECNEYNAMEVAKLATQFGFEKGEIRKDLSGKDRMWRGQKCSKN